MKTNNLKPTNPIPVRNPLSRCQRDFCRKDASIIKINHAIDEHQIPDDVNESSIEYIVQQWEQYSTCTCPPYWLLTARLFEMTLLCAGHYVDNCEYTSAGDLLFNPREIKIYQKGQPHPITKERHSRLSDQLKGYRSSTQRFPDWFKRHAAARITQPALLPYLRNRLAQSEQISAVYLQAADKRLKEACRAIGFLNSWSISSAEDLHCRLQAASPETQRFVDLHLCRFSTELFDALGKEIQRFSQNPHHQSKFIAEPPHVYV